MVNEYSKCYRIIKIEEKTITLNMVHVCRHISLLCIYTFLYECHTACVDAQNLNRVCMHIDI